MRAARPPVKRRPQLTDPPRMAISPSGLPRREREAAVSQTDPRTDRGQDPRLEGGELAGLLFESNPSQPGSLETASLRFVAVNSAAARCYGYTREEFLELTVRDICAPEDLDELLAEVWQAVEGPAGMRTGRRAAPPPQGRRAARHRGRLDAGLVPAAAPSWP